MGRESKTAIFSSFIIFPFVLFFYDMMIEGRANELPDFVVFRTVIKYCLYIIVIPVVSFLTTKLVIFDGLLRLEPITSSVYSAIVAVLVLHVLLGVYIYTAYIEAEKVPPKEVKKD